MTYNPNTPQPTDRISDTQAPIQTNFAQLNTIYGTNGDHYPWTNQNPGETTTHARVTLPALPTTNPPGNVLPTPGAGSCAIFAQADAGSHTYPFLRRDAGTVNYPLLPIKAWGTFVTISAPGAATLVNSFNVTSVTRTASAGQYNVVLPVGLNFTGGSVEYTILLSLGTAGGINTDALEFSITSATAFTINTFNTNTGTRGDGGTRISFVVIQ